MDGGGFKQTVGRSGPLQVDQNTRSKSQVVGRKYRQIQKTIGSHPILSHVLSWVSTTLNPNHISRPVHLHHQDTPSTLACSEGIRLLLDKTWFKVAQVRLGHFITRYIALPEKNNGPNMIRKEL